MDLKTRKLINNGCLPGFVPGGENIDQQKLANQANQTAWLKFKTRWNDGGGEAATNAVIGTLGAALQFNSMKFPTNYAGDFVGKYGTNTYGSIDGINYQLYNDIDTAAEENRMSQVRDSKILSGATLGATAGTAIGTSAGMLAGLGAGSWLGPVGAIAGLGLGALFGGIFGNSAKNEEEEQMRIAQIKLNNANEFWRTGALSTALRNKELERYGDTNRFNLFSGVKDGIENVHTNSGIKPGEPNAKVNNGEIIESKNGKAHKVVGNPNVIDGEYAKLKDGDNVYSSTLTIPGTDITYAEAYPIMKAMGRLRELLALQPISREMAHSSRMPDGLMRAWGGWENVLANGLGLIQSWRDYNDAANDDTHRTNITPLNPYEKKAAEIMAARRMTAYPQMRAITNEDAAQRYRINTSGGMSAMQKTMANITNAMGTKIARANALSNVQQINNQFAKENAELLDKMGAQSMDANVRAQMFNEQQNAAAQAARTQQMAMAKRNALDYVTLFVKNNWERNQFDRMMDLYWEGVKRDRLNVQNNGTPQKKKVSSQAIPTKSSIINTPKVTVPLKPENTIINIPQYEPLPQFNWPIKWR